MRPCIFAVVKILILDDIDDADMRNVKLGINTVAMIFDVRCCF